MSVRPNIEVYIKAKNKQTNNNKNNRKSGFPRAEPKPLEIHIHFFNPKLVVCLLKNIFSYTDVWGMIVLDVEKFIGQRKVKWRTLCFKVRKRHTPGVILQPTVTAAWGKNDHTLSISPPTNQTAAHSYLYWFWLTTVTTSQNSIHWPNAYQNLLLADINLRCPRIPTGPTCHQPWPEPFLWLGEQQQKTDDLCTPLLW